MEVKLNNHQVVLSDGRKLGFDQRGRNDGSPVFYFHGSPSSRLESKLFLQDELIDELKIRLISIDRPGIGLSDYQTGRSVLDWPHDVLAVADHLNIDRFAILAYSLGGPYGIACGYAIPERLTRIGIVSGAAFYSNPELMANVNQGTRNYLNLPREKPWMAKTFLNGMKLVARFAPKMMVKNANSLLPPSDKRVVSDLQIQNSFIISVNEAFRQGIQGSFHESLLMIQDWGFDPKKFSAPSIIWHGTEDQNIPLQMAEHLSGLLPLSKIEILEGEGHLSLFANNTRNILMRLLE